MKGRDHFVDWIFGVVWQLPETIEHVKVITTPELAM
jgi:hypothetical protein